MTSNAKIILPISSREFHVVYFLEEKSCQVVPTTWMKKMGNCVAAFWPLNGQQLAQVNADPDQSWKMSTCQILAYGDSYSAAEEKLKKFIKLQPKQGHTSNNISNNGRGPSFPVVAATPSSSRKRLLLPREPQSFQEPAVKYCRADDFEGHFQKVTDCLLRLEKRIDALCTESSKRLSSMEVKISSCTDRLAKLEEQMVSCREAVKTSKKSLLTKLEETRQPAMEVFSAISVKKYPLRGINELLRLENQLQEGNEEIRKEMIELVLCHYDERAIFYLKNALLNLMTESEWLKSVCYQQGKASKKLEVINALPYIHELLRSVIATRLRLNEKRWRKAWRAFFKNLQNADSRKRRSQINMKDASKMPSETSGELGIYGEITAESNVVDFEGALELQGFTAEHFELMSQELSENNDMENGDDTQQEIMLKEERIDIDHEEFGSSVYFTEEEGLDGSNQ